MLNKLETNFIEEYTNTGKLASSMRKAINKAGGDDSLYNQKYLHLKAKRLIAKDRIKNEITKREAILQANATLGVQKIQQIIKHGEESNSLKASIFSVEMVEGKAKQKIESTSTAIKLNIDLSGNAQPALEENNKTP